MRKSLYLSVTLFLITSAGWSHPLADKARAVQEQAARLGERMTSTGQTLTWGQDMAVQDMQRLVSAASATAQALDPDAPNWDEVRPTVVELQVAASRVRMTLPVSNLDDEARKIGQQMVVQVEEIDMSARGERDQQFQRNLSDTRPAPFSFGVGFGTWGNFGRPWIPFCAPVRGGWTRSR